MTELLQVARIVIVDDDVANICLLQNVLNRVGFRNVESFADSRESFSRIAESAPDLIILDLNMPFLDGFGVMQQLDQAGLRDNFLPVLVLTADATSKTKRKALAAGASDLLTKPFDASEVFMRIRNLLEMRFLHRQLQEHNQTLEAKVADRTRELRDVQQQVVAQERLRAFGEMAGGVVHDFNNALMSVIGYSELLLDDEEMLTDLPTARSYLKIMNTAGHDASHVISRLRDFYRPKDVVDVFTAVDLNEIIEEAVPLTRPKWKDQALATGRSIHIQLELAKVPPILGNAAELREVVTNLIFNAVDAIEHEGTITLRSGSEADEVLIELIDTGTGMDEKTRTRCLEPFFSTKGDKGTGLGLSMVFGIVKRHDGTVEIESEVGKGTTFRLRFRRSVDAAEVTEDQERAIARRLRVLVVDDEPVARDVLRKFMLADGHNVVVANDGESALRDVQNGAFDLLITDQGMPGMSGTQLAAKVREMSPQQAVILVTGFTDGTAGSGDVFSVVDAVLQKPIAHRRLRRAIASIMRW